jgi:hypothetical protein
VSVEEQPVREERVLHRCLCVLLHPVQDSPDTWRDECCAFVGNPESPLCWGCAQSEHDQMPHVPYPDVLRERGS